MSFTRIGVPFLAVITVFSMSCTFLTRPNFLNVDLLQAGFDKASARIGVVVGELLLHLPDAQPVGDELVGVHANLIFARRAAEAGNIHDVGNGLEVLLHHPVFERLQLHHVIRRIRAVQREEIDLPGWAPVRLYLRRHSRGNSGRRKSDLREPLQRPLAVLEILFFVIENELNIGKAEQRKRPQVGYVRDAVHHDFERNGDLLLHLLGGNSRPLRDNFHVIIRHVGIRFHRKLMKGNSHPNRITVPPPRARETGSRGRNRPACESPIGHPYCSTVFWNTSALVTT